MVVALDEMGADEKTLKNQFYSEQHPAYDSTLAKILMLTLPAHLSLYKVHWSVRFDILEFSRWNLGLLQSEELAWRS